MTQFDKKNFCVNIREEKDSPLLPKFKEWMNEKSGFKFLFDGKYYGNHGGNYDAYFDPTCLYTLAQLRELMPEIWGDAVQVKIGDTVVTERFETYGVIDLVTSMELFIGKSGVVTDINEKGHYEVHGWYWPASAVRLVPPDEQVQHKPRVFSLDELQEAFEAARLHHPLAGTKYDRFEDFVKERHGIFIPLTLSDKIQAITGNAEMTQQILKVVEDSNDLNSK